MTIEQQIELLKKELADLNNARLDVPLTQRAQEEHEAKCSDVRNRLNVLGFAQYQLARRGPGYEADVAYIKPMSKIRDVQCKELLAIGPRPKGIEHGKSVNLQIGIAAIDTGLGVVENSGWDLSTLRLGQLMKEAGIEWRGSIPEVERRIAETKALLDDCEARAKAALNDESWPKRLLGKLLPG